MKKTVQLSIILISIILFNSCSNDDYEKSAPNVVLINGEYQDLNGSYISLFRERQEDNTWKYAFDQQIFGGNIKYVSLQEGYKGKGFFISIAYFTNKDYLDAGEYKFNINQAPFTFFATYWKNTDIDNDTPPNPTLIKSGTITVERGSSDIINFDLVDENDVRIKGTFDKPIIGLYVKEE